jgi:CRP-like cAMP-binding protein
MVVIDGSFTVVRDGVVIADLGPGQIAGEMALLSGSVCNASVIASDSASVLELGPNEFATLLEVCPGVTAQVQQTASRRLAHTALT